METDSDMALEDELEKLQIELDEYTEKVSTFRLGYTNHKINDKVDSALIFEAASKNTKTQKFDDCQSCKQTTFTKDNQIKYCEFCGKSVCKDCFTKSRPFPKAALDKNGERVRGEICRLCDRKFLIRQMLLENQSNAAKKTNEQKKQQK